MLNPNGETPQANGGARPPNVGIVGLGYWGPNLARVVAESPRLNLRWLCDRDAGRLDRMSARYPGAHTTAEFDDLLGDDQVDAVLLATPVFTHFDLASRALRAGKHTFVEKPLAPSVDQANSLVRRARSAGLVLMCGHTFIYSPAVRAVKQLISSGELGELLYLSSSRVNLGLHQRDVSVVWDLAPHDFSILLHWLEDVPVTVRASGRDSIVSGIPDVAFIALEYASGLVVNVELSWLAPSKLRRTVVVGREKMVVYEDGSQEPVKVFDHGVVFKDPETFGEYHLSYRTGDIVAPKIEAYEPLSRELEDFASAVQDGTTPLSSPTLARDVVRLTQAADQSLRSGGEPVSIASRNSRFRRSRIGTPVAS